MDVTFELEGPLAEAAGGERHRRELPPGTTVRDALGALADGNDDLQGLLFRAGGAVRPHLVVSVDGEPVGQADEAAVGDRVAVAPGLGC
jgi:sulfur carrier protein ThiS